MNKEDTEFVMKYAKLGILASKNICDEIEFEELKDNYFRIKKEVYESEKETPIKKETPKDGEKKPSAIKKWVAGIGDRQRKYKEAHEGDII